jgi:hypothetical protein
LIDARASASSFAGRAARVVFVAAPGRPLLTLGADLLTDVLRGAAFFAVPFTRELLRASFRRAAVLFSGGFFVDVDLDEVLAAVRFESFALVFAAVLRTVDLDVLACRVVLRAGLMGPGR